jgi:DNA replication protein DnaC
MAKAAIPINPGDYVGEDGLLYCGKCYTRKQTRVTILGVERTPMCMCRCQAEEVERKRAEEAAERYKDELLTKCFMVEEMRNWRFENDNGNNPELRTLCENFVVNFDEFREAGRGLLLFGQTGVGKSWFAGCIANALIDKGIACKYLDFTQIANILNDLGSGRNDYIQTLARYPLLILDDLCAERNTSYMDEIVFSVIDARSKAHTPLIVTTNLSAEDIKKATDVSRKRIISRLYESCIPYEVKGRDQRSQGLIADYERFKGLLGIGG